VGVETKFFKGILASVGDDRDRHGGLPRVIFGAYSAGACSWEMISLVSLAMMTV
jgi:hypothetical protein